MSITIYHNRWLITILFVALLLRVTWAIGLHRFLQNQSRTYLIAGDADGYWQLATAVADGHDYSVYQPPRRVLRMPGFPVFLAGCIRLFGNGQFPARLALCLVGTCACGLVYWLGRTIADPATGLLACGLSAISPAAIGFTPLILSETLFALLMLASLLTMAWLLKRHQGAADKSAQRWNTATLSAAVGILTALACYVRPSWLLAGPLLGAVLILLSRHRRTAICHAGLLLIALVAALVPWGVRNHRVTGHFVLTTLWVGPSLFDGLNPDATGDSDMAFFDHDNLMSEMSEYDVDRHYRSAAWQFVREQPGRALQLAGAKLLRFWNPCPNAEQFRSWWACLGLGGFFVSAAALAGVGCWKNRRHAPFLILTVGPILYFTAIHLVFVSSLRYRLPAEYPLFVASAAGLLAVRLRLRSRPVPPTLST